MEQPPPQAPADALHADVDRHRLRAVRLPRRHPRRVRFRHRRGRAGPAHVDQQDQHHPAVPDRLSREDPPGSGREGSDPCELVRRHLPECVEGLPGREPVPGGARGVHEDVPGVQTHARRVEGLARGSPGSDRRQGDRGSSRLEDRRPDSAAGGVAEDRRLTRLGIQHPRYLHRRRQGGRHVAVPLPLRLLRRGSSRRQGAGGMVHHARRRSEGLGERRPAHRCPVRELDRRELDLDREGVHAVVRQADGRHRRDHHRHPDGGLLHHAAGGRQHHGAVGA